MQTLWQILLFILLLYIGACITKLTRQQKQINQTFEDILPQICRPQCIESQTGGPENKP